jgi:PAS domain S-box-containing protein
MTDRPAEIPDLTALMAQLPVALCVCEAPNGLIRLYNRRAAELWGREPAAGQESFCGAARLFHTNGTYLPHAETPMAEVLLSGDDRNEDLVIERPDGSRVTVRVNVAALRDAHGRIVGAVNAFYDVSERKLTDADAAGLAAIVVSAEDAIISKSLDGHIMSWNRAAELMFGYPAAEALGKSIAMIIPPERLQEEEIIITRLTRGESVEHTSRRRDSPGMDGEFRSH